MLGDDDDNGGCRQQIPYMGMRTGEGDVIVAPLRGARSHDPHCAQKLPRPVVSTDASPMSFRCSWASVLQLASASAAVAEDEDATEASESKSEAFEESGVDPIAIPLRFWAPTGLCLLGPAWRVSGVTVTTTKLDTNESVHSTFASRYVRASLPRFKFPENSIPKEAAYQIINDELMLDGNPRLNLASFVTTWMEPECDKLMMAAVNKNYVDMDEYPVTTELQNRCVNMIAHLFHAPIGDDETAIGVGTVGSSEAIMLAGLAFKRRWQNRRKAEGKPYDKPNIVTGANVQVCWEKFARYFEVELKEVKLREGYYVIDPAKAVEMVDENTICVAAILGSTLTGEFEDVKLINDLLIEKNKETGWDTPIHVDAASGGFIAPFLYPELEWDFRLPCVKSINVSGHKFGLVYAGVGWVVWRNKEDLPEELIFHINYLGADQPTFTLNFSKGSSQIIAQYYQFIRLGFEGYKNIMQNCSDNAKVLKAGIDATGLFDVVSKDVGVPLVAFSLKDSSRYTVFDVSESLRRFGWIVPAYTMPPDAEHVAVLRVVIREDFSRSLAERLVVDIQKVLVELDHRWVRATSMVHGKTDEKLDGAVACKKSAHRTHEEIARFWKSLVDRKKKTSGVC